VIARDDLSDLAALLRRFARPYWALLAATAGLGLVIATLSTAQPLLLAPALDLVGVPSAPPAASWRDVTLNNVGPTLVAWWGLDRGPARMVAVTVGAYVALVVLTSLGAFGTMLLVLRVRTQIFRDLQAAVYAHLLSLSMRYFVRQRTGDFASRLTNDAFHCAQLIETATRALLQSGAQLALCAVLLLRTDAILTGGVLVVFAVHLGITRLLRDRVRTLAVDQFDLFAALVSRVHETMLTIRVVKSFAAERFEHARFLAEARHLVRVIVRGAIYKYVENPLREIADAVGFGVVLLMATWALSRGRLTVAGLVLFVVLVRQALVPISRIGEAVLSMQALAGSSRGLVEILRERPAVTDGRRAVHPLIGAVGLEAVSFGYEKSRRVLHEVSFEIQRGEFVALVGPSGGGKSTLADLVLRLHDPDSGRVTWDGIDVRDFRQEDYRRRFGVVSQEALLFNATVSENIAYGREVDREAVVRAAVVAHADAFIRDLPRGYDTVVGDRGIRLSGGQRQRIAIARAVYSGPDVLVLDEATSALDSESEAQVQAALEEVVGRLTLLVIAHRLSTVIRADRIVLLNEGRVEAVGAHEDLLARAPLYRRLCDAQFGAAPVAIRSVVSGA
jgi:subfamily B ATP-binding cassette protein MsbA